MITELIYFVYSIIYDMRYFYEGPDAVQQLVGRVGNPTDITNMILFLCSNKAGFITGENICIDGGMTKQMIYHDEHGWKYEG